MVGAALVALLLSYAPASEVCRFTDPQLTESSGVSASARSDEVLFTHNDSGDGARLFAVDTRTGDTVGTVEVEGARADDWEDMARGLTADGRPALFLADIGDNFKRRPAVVVYEIEEPAAVVGTVTAKVRVRHELRYTDGAHDAETLLVDPRTRAMVVLTKDREGVSGVYRADAGSPTLFHIADIDFAKLVERPGAYAKAATGGDISPDGRRVVVRTPFEAFEWDVAPGALAFAFNNPPRRIPLPAVEQGEAIAYTRDGRSLVVTSEGRNAPVHRLPGDHDVGPDLLVPRVETSSEGSDDPWWYRFRVAVVLTVLATVVQRARRGRRRRRRRPPGPAVPLA